jgi:lauroyl/myristoyl acyltransferase
MLRAWRHWLRAQATDAAVALAPRLSPAAVARIENALRRLGPWTPVLGRQIADNMRAAGVFSAEDYRRHFAHLAAHAAGALFTLRCATRGTDAASPLLDYARERVLLDDSLALIEQARAQGRGVVLTGPHLANYLVSLALLHRQIPLAIYFRYAKDARHRRAKDAWWHASGIEPILEPPSDQGAPDRVGRIAAALHDGKVVYVPPDLPRKLGDGVPVRVGERTVCLPAGPAVLASRTGAPLFALLARQDGARLRLYAVGPAPVAGGPDAPDVARERVQARMQWFADLFSVFLCEHAPLWYFWGDKRWTRVWRDDPRYVRGTHGEDVPPTAVPAPHGAGGAQA